jgi:hypothetical protein
MISLLRGQPHRRRLLAPHHQINIILRAEAVGDRRQETVRVGREVHPREFGLEVQYGSYKGGVLVREAVVFLARPGGGLDVVEGATGLAPGRLGCLVGI